MDRKHKILSQFFGYTSFRDGQDELISAVLDGRDVFGILPTGGGKSLCYQVPAMLLDGLTIVVSPLISLMKDQVMALVSAGIPAAYLNSSLNPAQIARVYQNLVDRTYKILYISPERLTTTDFLRCCRSLEISFLAVDEAHCISQWGQDFRPGYLQIATFLKSQRHRPMVGAFTATASPSVREDIVHSLGLRNPLIVATGYDRPNLFFDVRSPLDKAEELQEYLLAHPDRSGIVYCSTRKDVDLVCHLLQANGFSATRYHAGLPDAERQANQDAFAQDRVKVMVATNAFGMGIDKPNISFVIHYNIPLSMESYYQEAGRAGRDGSPGDCILLFSMQDVRTARVLVSHTAEGGSLSEAERLRLQERDVRRLQCMVDYCQSSDCYHSQILNYFGQPNVGACGSCGNCRSMGVPPELADDAHTILQAYRRIRRHLTHGLSPITLRMILLGSQNKQITALNVEALPAYGCMRNRSPAELTRIMEHMEQLKLYAVEPQTGFIVLTPLSSQVLFHGKNTLSGSEHSDPKPPAKVRKSQKNKTKPKKSRPKKDVSQLSEADQTLYRLLQEVRRQLAKEYEVPAASILANAGLADMAEQRPKNAEQLLNIHGIGSAKAQKFGPAFLAAIRKSQKL